MGRDRQVLLLGMSDDLVVELGAHQSDQLCELGGPWQPGGRGLKR